jgi:hypothetical protein
MLLALVVLAAVLVAVVGSHNTTVAAGAHPVSVTIDAPAPAGGSPVR